MLLRFAIATLGTVLLSFTMSMALAQQSPQQSPQPTPSPTATPSPTVTPSTTATPSPTISPSATPSATPSPTATPTPSPTATPTSTNECQGQAILQAPTCAGDGLEPEEEKLYELINEHRAKNGLPAIPHSSALNRVANRHVHDMADNLGRLTIGWSNCPYNASDRNTYACMWEAPKRLNTGYPGMGYENAHFNPAGATAQSALSSWQASSAHNALLLNQGVWKDYNWQAIGVGIYKNYAVVWLGKEPDTAGAASNAPAPN